MMEKSDILGRRRRLLREMETQDCIDGRDQFIFAATEYIGFDSFLYVYFIHLYTFPLVTFIRVTLHASNCYHLVTEKVRFHLKEKASDALWETGASCILLNVASSLIFEFAFWRFGIWLELRVWGIIEGRWMVRVRV